MARLLFQIITVLTVVVFLASCEDDSINSPDAQLEFSTDTVMFDTIFTTIGSTTQHFKVINPYSESILISKVRLAGGDFSNFRLNINGISGNEVSDVEIPPNDSIYIFVEVTIDPSGQNLPMVVQDSIEFVTNLNVQNIDLIAWGQDFKLIKGETIKTTTWTNEKPYLVYNFAFVDSLETLTIEAGTKIYFHKGAGLYVKGTLQANGTNELPINFQGDRMEDSYKNLPDQWNGILLYSGSRDNIINYATVRNANIGLQVGTIEHEGKADLMLSNSRIENMAYAGIFALKSDISGFNNVVSNCGFYAMALLVGGNYEFFHSTVANYWGGFSSRQRTTASLVLSNVLIVENTNGTKTKYTGDLNKATFGNCIIYGNNPKEIELGKNDESDFNFLFDHCILQVPDTFNTSNKDNYKTIWKGSKFDPKFIDPYEKNTLELDTLSPAKDIGSLEFSKLYPFDLKKQDRTADSAPDVGAFERVEKKSR